MSMFRRLSICAALWLSGVLITCGTAFAADQKSQPSEKQLSAADIVDRCQDKLNAEDQNSKLTITLKDKGGNEKKTVYLRYWKNYHGKDGIANKMVLFTEFPPDAKGAGFLRWAYTAEAHHNADQWIYLPVLKRTRRVSVRDPGDSFLGSDLTYFDIDLRAIDEDEHRLLRIERVRGIPMFVVESIPKEKNPLYSKRVTWYANQTSGWNDCIRVRVDYFDKLGEPLKRQVLRWQHVGDVWVWDKVLVENVQTQHSSLFETTDVKINTGLDDDIFTERNLRKGPR